jgi:hypothetical protein
MWGHAVYKHDTTLKMAFGANYYFANFNTGPPSGSRQQQKKMFYLFISCPEPEALEVNDERSSRESVSEGSHVRGRDQGQ